MNGSVPVSVGGRGEEDRHERRKKKKIGGGDRRERKKWEDIGMRGSVFQLF